MSKVIKGDTVVTRDKRIGLITGFSPRGRAEVEFAQGRPVRFLTINLRRATIEEVEASPLNGVGCNQSMQGVIRG